MMSYYNYCDNEYTALVDFGAAGELEVYVSIDVDIDYRDIIDEMGEDVWDYLDVEQHIIHNHTDYMEGIVEEACSSGLEDLVNCLVKRYKENDEESELQYMIEAATKAIHELNNVEQGDLL